MRSVGVAGRLGNLTAINSSDRVNSGSVVVIMDIRLHTSSRLERSTGLGDMCALIGGLG